MNFSVIFNLTFQDVQFALGSFIERLEEDCGGRVTGAEIRISCPDPFSQGVPARAIIDNVTSYVMRHQVYAEVKNKNEWVQVAS